MELETGIYQILRKHKLSLKKREEVIVDLLAFVEKREKAIEVIRCSTEFCFNCSSDTKNEIDSKSIVRCDNCGIKR